MVAVVPALFSVLLAQAGPTPTTPATTTSTTSTASTTSEVAEVAPARLPDEPTRKLHFGLEARADLWRHPLRTAIGLQSGAFDLSLITDPGVFIDGKNDLDLIFGWWIAPHAWQLSIGYRNSSMPVANGRRFDETLLLGIDAAMPRLDGKHVRATFGLMLAADLVRHGGGIPTYTIPHSLADISDYLSFGFNARFEYALGF